MHVQALLNSLDACVGQCIPVQVVQNYHEDETWHQSEVNFANKSLLLRRVLCWVEEIESIEVI